MQTCCSHSAHTRTENSCNKQWIWIGHNICKPMYRVSLCVCIYYFHYVVIFLQEFSCVWGVPLCGLLARDHAPLLTTHTTYNFKRINFKNSGPSSVKNIKNKSSKNCWTVVIDIFKEY